VNKVVVATQDGFYVVGDDTKVELEGEHINALALDAGGSVLALADGHSLLRRDSKGEWTRLARYTDRRLTSLLPVDGAVLAGTSEAHLVRVSSDGIEPVDGFESAEGRAEWFTPWGGPPDVRTLAAGETGEIYANVHVGGILRSDDAGASWRPTLDIHADVHEVTTVHRRPGLVLAAGAAGLSVSHDGGATWTLEAEGLHAGYCRAVAVGGDTVLLTASVGPFGGRAAIYRRPLEKTGGAFEKCEGGLPDWFSDNIDSGCVATSGSTAAFGTSDGRLFLSEDEGAQWREIASDLPPVEAVRFVRL
jgi:hypothetical protein